MHRLKIDKTLRDYNKRQRRRQNNAATRKPILKPGPEHRSRSALGSDTGGEPESGFSSSEGEPSSSDSDDDKEDHMELDPATPALRRTDVDAMLAARFSHATTLQQRNCLSARAVEEAAAAATLAVAKAQASMKHAARKPARKKGPKKRKKQTDATHPMLPPSTRRSLNFDEKKSSGANTSRKVVIPFVYFFLLSFLFVSCLLDLFDFLLSSSNNPPKKGYIGDVQC